MTKLRELFFNGLIGVGLVGLSALMSVPAQARSGVGINLAAVAYWSGESAFIDLMKQAGGWATQCSPYSSNPVEREMCQGFGQSATAFDTKEQDKLDLDENGYPHSLPSPDDRSVKFRTVLSMIHGNSATPTLGKYIVLYEGDGTLDYSGGVMDPLQSTKGRHVVNLTSATSSFSLKILTTVPGNHVRNIRVIPPGGHCSGDADAFALDAASCAGTFTPLEEYSKTHTFHPKFISHMKNWRNIRFLDYLKTNDPETDWGGVVRPVLKEWDQRTRRTERVWNKFGHGIPPAVAFELTKEAGTDLWYNLGTYISDDFARQFGEMAEKRLKRDQTLYLEYGNEAWNTMFLNSKWIRQQGKALFPDEPNEVYAGYNFHAYRTVQLCSLVKAQFKDPSRVQCVLGSQTSQGAPMGPMGLGLECVRAQPLLGGRPCHEFVDQVAVAPYFGSSIGASKHDYEDRIKKTGKYIVSEYNSLFDGRPISEWVKDPDGGSGALFRELELYELPKIREWMQYSLNVANKYGVKLMAYEGGQHLVATNNDIRPGVMAMFESANNDSRMGVMYTQYMNNWKSVGGETLTLFNSIGKGGPSGYWGMLPHMMNDSAPKWDSARAFRDNIPCWWTHCHAAPARTKMGAARR
jgi:hypothetical protein